MIISASYRTDIPAFYGDWFMARLAAGLCRPVNPWNRQPYDVPLMPDNLDGFVFWTRHLRPFMGRLEEVAAVAPFYVHYTVTAYPRALEQRVVEPARATNDLHDLAAAFGPRAAVWRYDPILLTSLTPPDWHVATFTRLAAELSGTVDEVVLSFAHLYRKTRRNLDAAARDTGFTWEDPPAATKKDLAHRLIGIATAHGMRATFCSQPEFLVSGAGEARCIDAIRLSDIAGRRITAPRAGNRPDCRCDRSRDIGAYDTCPHGCVYCYAFASPAAARRRHKAHDPAAAALGEVHEEVRS